MKNILQKLSVATTTAMIGVVTFAADGGGDYDFSAVNTELGKVSDAVKSWVTSALPYILGIGGVVLIFFLARIGYKMLKTMISAGK